MTEPQGGADPGQFICRAYPDGEEWVIDGWKFFSSHARWAVFLIVMTVTDPDNMPYRGASMFLVEAALRDSISCAISAWAVSLKKKGPTDSSTTTR